MNARAVSDHWQFDGRAAAVQSIEVGWDQCSTDFVSSSRRVRCVTQVLFDQRTQRRTDSIYGRANRRALCRAGVPSRHKLSSRFLSGSETRQEFRPGVFLSCTRGLPIAWATFASELGIILVPDLDSEFACACPLLLLTYLLLLYFAKNNRGAMRDKLEGAHQFGTMIAMVVKVNLADSHQIKIEAQPYNTFRQWWRGRSTARIFRGFMSKLPTIYGQIQLPADKRDHHEIWNDVEKLGNIKAVKKADWYEPWLGDDTPIRLTAPPNLLAKTLGADGDVIGIVRLCWLPDDVPTEIRFQGDGDEFRVILENIRECLNGELSEGDPTD